MRNIRLDSLPTDREIASQNCKTCIKRRIKCDRSIPSCQKCCSRGISCSGYSLRLRWDQGVASRGRLKGKTVPLRSPAQDDKTDTSKQPYTSTVKRHADDNTCPTQNHQRHAEGSLAVASYSRQNVQLVDRHVRQKAHAVLLHHFNQVVASKLPWLDGPDNPWRTLLLPLTQRSTCLWLSTLGLAAAHMSVVSPQNQAGLVQIHRDLRDATLRILSQRMQSELSREATPIHEDSEASGLIEMILTMICLCYGEMFIPNSTGWKLHLTGVRAGFERYNLRYHYEESVSRFFVEELEYLEAFGSISSFTPTSRRRKPISQHPTCDDYFKEFTDSLHDITATERSQHQAYQAGSPFADTNMSVWKNQLMSSYEAVCARIDSTPPQDVAVQIGLRSLLKAQHYACLVYSYQALAPDSEREKAIPTLVDCLYNEIIFMTSWPTEAVSHNISFPLFILGTESQLYTEKQIMVERLFTESIAATGFSCNSTVLQFLNEFWNATADGAPKSWIQYARENKEKISPFIVF